MEATTTCKRELLLEIPPEVVKRETESVTKEYAKVARIPGFRPGRAPQTLVRRRFQEEIKDDVVKSLVPKFFENAVKEQRFSVVGRPRFEDLKFEESQPLTIRATFEIYPEIQLGQYQGLEVDEEPVAVTGEDVNKALDELRERAATFEVVEDREAAQDDYLMVRYEGRDVNDTKIVRVPWREGMVHLGGLRTIQGFTENLLGSRVGDTRRFEVAYPDDFPEKDLAGKRLDYQVEIQGIKRKVVPSADDEFAKSVSDFSTLDELKDDLRRTLEQRREAESKAASRRKLIDQLIANHDFPVPGTLIEARLDRRLQSALGRLIAQGVDPAAAGLDWRKIREDMRSDAEKEVRGALILDKIGDAEGIEASEADVDEAIREMAQSGHETPAALKTRLTQDDEIDTLKSSCRNQKVLDFIYQKANISHKPGAVERGPEVDQKAEPG